MGQVGGEPATHSNLPLQLHSLKMGWRQPGKRRKYGNMVGTKFQVALIVAIAALAGCTTVSERTVFKGDGIVVTQMKATDHALKMTGHGGYIAVVNVIDVYGKKYSMAGEGRGFVTVSDRKLLFFVAGIPREIFGSDRELHVVNTVTRAHAVIPLGDGTWSGLGDDFGHHMPGSRYEEKVEFEDDDVVRFTTYDGRTTPTEVYEPTNKTVFVVSLRDRKLLSRHSEPIVAKGVGQK